MKPKQQNKLIQTQPFNENLSQFRSTSKKKLFQSQKIIELIKQDNPIKSNIILPKISSNFYKQQPNQSEAFNKLKSQSKSNLQLEKYTSRESPIKNLKDAVGSSSQNNHFIQTNMQPIKRAQSLIKRSNSRGNILISSQSVSRIKINSQRKSIQSLKFDHTQSKEISSKQSPLKKHQPCINSKINIQSPNKLNNTRTLGLISLKKVTQNIDLIHKRNLFNKQIIKSVDNLLFLSNNFQSGKKQQFCNQLPRITLKRVQNQLQTQQQIFKSHQQTKEKLDQQILQQDPFQNLNTQINIIKPRIFLSSQSNIPYNILMYRTINNYRSFDINVLIDEAIQNLIKKQQNSQYMQFLNRQNFWGQGQWQLIYYDNQLDYVYEYIGSKQHLRQNQQYRIDQIVEKQVHFTFTLKSHAFIRQYNRYLPLQIHSYYYDNQNDFFYFKGKIIKSQTQQQSKILNQQIIINESQFIVLHRLYVCFQFQNPLTYIERIQKAINQRQKYLYELKFNFISQNILMSKSQKLNYTTFRSINSKLLILKPSIKVSSFKYNDTKTENYISFEDENQLNQMFRTVNNKLLLKQMVSNWDQKQGQYNQAMDNSDKQEEQRLQEVLQKIKSYKVQNSEIDQHIEHQAEKNINLINKKTNLHLTHLKLPAQLIKKPNPPFQLANPMIIKINQSVQKNQNIKQSKYLKLYHKTLNTKILQLRTKWIYQQDWMMNLIQKATFYIKDFSSCYEKQQSLLTKVDLLKFFDLKFIENNASSPLIDEQDTQVQNLPSNKNKIPTLDEFLTVRILNKMDNTLTSQINRNVNKIIQLFYQIIQRYKQNTLYSRQQQDQSEESNIKTTQFDLQQTINNKDKSVQKQNQFSSIKGSQIQSNKKASQNYQLPITSFYQQKLQKSVLMIDQMIKQEIKLILKSQITTFTQIITQNQTQLRNMILLEIDLKQQKYNQYQQKVNPKVNNHNKQQNLRKFISLSLSSEEIVKKFILFISTMLRKLNTSVGSVKKSLQLFNQIKTSLSEQLLQDGDKYLKIFSPKSTYKQKILQRFTIERQKKEENSQINYSNKNNKYEKYNQQQYFYSYMSPLMQCFAIPLIQQVHCIQRNLKIVKIPNLIQIQDKQQFDVQTLQKQSNELIEQAYNKKIDQSLEPLVNILFYLQYGCQMFNKICLKKDLSLQKHVSFHKNLIYHNLNDLNIENSSIVKVSAINLIEQVGLIEEQIILITQLSKRFQTLFSLNQQSMQKVSNVQNQMMKVLKSKKLIHLKRDFINIQTKPLYQKISAKLIVKFQQLKKILSDKFIFEVSYVQSQLHQLQQKLSIVPKNVEQLISKLQYIQRINFLSSNSSIGNTVNNFNKQLDKLPGLQFLITACFRNTVKLSRTTLTKYYINNIKVNNIIKKILPQKISQCMLKKQIVYRQIADQQKTLNQIYVQFNRNLTVLIEQTEKTIHKVHKSIKTNKQINQNNSTQLIDKNIAISTYQDIQVPIQLKIPFHFSISQNIKTLYVEIIGLCKRINYKQNLFIQKTLSQQSHSKNVNTQLTKSLLPYSLQSLESLYLNYYKLWNSLKQWDYFVKNIYIKEIGDIVLQKPEQKIIQILTDLKQVSQFYSKKISSNLQKHPIKATINQILNIQKTSDNKQIVLLKSVHSFVNQTIQQISNFMKGPLNLLKILKKQGFTKKHLQKIGIQIQGLLQALTLKKALKMNFLQHLQLIQAVSNDAWFSFHLQSTLQRILLNLSKLKFEFSLKHDKNQNQMLYIVNYTDLNQKVEQILINLETIHKNPAKSQFQMKLKSMHKQSVYISRSLQVLQSFQSRFLMISPIFQSTEIKKQLPLVYQKFVKIYRPWNQLVTFMKRMSSVLDSCNSQNIHQKISNLILKLDIVRSELSSYLQQKRRTFSKFFFLSDQQIFKLFSNTKQLTAISKMLGNIIFRVEDLTIQQNNIITHIKFGGRSNLHLKLQKPILTKQKNLQIWLSQLQKSLKNTIKAITSQYLFIQTQKKEKNPANRDYIQLIKQPCNQVILLIEQILNHKEINEIKDVRGIDSLINQNQKLFNKLIGIKRNLLSSSVLIMHQQKTLNSIIIIVSHQINVLKCFKSTINDFSSSQWKNSFEFKKLIKYQPIFHDNQLISIDIQSFDCKFQYGFQFIGLNQRIIVTDLTERVFIFCLQAFNNQQGNACFGPAATGKSQTIKDVSYQLGKNCLIYNCSKNFQLQTLIRVLKGIISSGIFVCFDEFNLLDYSTISILAQNLYLIFKYRSYKSQINISFERDYLLLKPDFHVSICYNPNYEGRQEIPLTIKNIFRSLAMVKLDIQKICLLKLYLEGFSEASSEISMKLSRIFYKSQLQWPSTLYDFGLRTLLSIIKLSSQKLKLLKIKSKSISPARIQKKIIVQSLLKVVQSCMKPFDQYIFQVWIETQFQQANFDLKQDLRKNNSLNITTESKNLINLTQLFKIRNGVIIFGKSLSGKQNLIKSYIQANKDKINYEKVFVDILNSRQIYGEMNQALNIWNDGVLTRLIKEFINILKQKQKLQQKQNSTALLIFDGLLHYDWMQNLNTVLDQSKVFNIGSGQSIKIPTNIQFLFVCENLHDITPASLSRNGILSMNQYTEEQLWNFQIKKLFMNIKAQQMVHKQQELNNILKFYKQFLVPSVLNSYLKYKIQKLNIFYWIIKFMKNNHHLISLQGFIFIFWFSFEGLISENGRKICLQRFKKQLSNQPNQKVQQKLNLNQITPQNRQKYESKLILNRFIQKVKSQSHLQDRIPDDVLNFQYQIINERKIKVFHSDTQEVNFHAILVKTEKYRNFQYLLNSVLKHAMNNEEENQMIAVFGQGNSGKSTFISSLGNILQTSKQLNVTFKQLFFTNSTAIQTFHNNLQEILYKKSSHKLGGLPGNSIIVQIQDFYLSPKNQQRSNQFYSNYQILRTILKQKHWYNYKSLQKQKLQNLIFIGDWRLQRKKLNLSQKLQRHIIPLFLPEIERLQSQKIFSTLTNAFLRNSAKFIRNGQKNIFGLCREQSMIDIQNIIRTRLMKFVEEINSFYCNKFYNKSQSIINLTLINMRDIATIINSVFEWEFEQNESQKEEISLTDKFSQILCYQILRVAQSKLNQPQYHLNFKLILSKHFSNVNQFQISNQNFQKDLIFFPNCLLKAQNKKIKLSATKIQDIDLFASQIQFLVDQFTNYNKELYKVQNDNIIVFRQFYVTFAKLIRALLSKKSHILFLSFPTSGKTTLTKLCAFILKGNLQKLQHSYNSQTWLQSLKTSTKICFRDKIHTILMLPQEYLSFSSFNQDISQFLYSNYVKKAYSQADFQELIYVQQSFLLKNNLQVNRQNCKYFFIEYLKHKFHLVLNLYPGTKQTLTLLNSYPALVKQTNIFSLVEWPQEALLLAAKRYFLVDKINNSDYNLENTIVQIYQKAKQLSLVQKLSIWNGHYFEFIQTFKQDLAYHRCILNLQKQNLQKGLSIVLSTQKQIGNIRTEIKKIQPTIIQLQKQTQRTLKSINIQKVSLQQTNQNLDRKNKEYQDIIEQSEILKKQLDLMNGEVNQKLDKVWQNVQLIKQNHISEIKSLNNPSQFIKIVLTALVIIFYHGPIIKQKDQKGLGWEQNYFQTARKYVLNEDAQTLAQMLTGFDKDSIQKDTVKKIEQKCMSHKKWNQKQAKSANKAVFYFFLWVQSIVKHFHMFQETQPLRKQLRQVNYLIKTKIQQTQQVKFEKQRVQKRIQQLTEEVQAKQNKLAEYSSQVAYYQKTINRGEQILRQISEEKQKWQKYLIQIDNEFTNLQGKSLIRTSLMVYGSSQTFDQRNKLKKEIFDILTANQISFTKNYWYFKPMYHQELFKILEISEDQFMIDNLMIIESSKKPITMIDPEEQGVRYILQKNKFRDRLIIIKANESNIDLRKKVQQTIEQSRILLLQFSPQQINQSKDTINIHNNSHVSNNFLIKTILKIKNQVKHPQSLQQYVSNQYRKNQFFINSLSHQQNHLSQFQQSPLVRMNSLSQIFFYTKSSSLQLIDFVVNTQVINFTLTPLQLQNRLNKVLVSCQFPDVQLQIDQTTKFSIKSKIQLQEIEIKILDMFVSNIATQLIQDEQVLNTLSSSNRLYRQINSKLKQSQEKKNILKQQAKKFKSQAQRLARIYFVIKKIKMLAKSSVFSFKWFLRILTVFPKNCADMIAMQVGMSVEKNNRIIVQFMIAQAYHSRLRWDLIFHSRSNDCVNIQNQNNVQKVIHKLHLTQSEANQVLAKINKVNDYIDGLQKHFIEKPQTFKFLLTSSIPELFAFIPNEFSHLEHFDRIILVSCFRDQRVILTLIRQWLKINFPHFYSLSNQNNSAVSYHQKRQPIILIFDKATLSEQKNSYIDQMYKKNSASQKSVITISMVKSNIQKLKLMLNTARQNDQWLVIQGIFSNFYQTSWALIQYFQQKLDLTKINEFKVFIQVDSIEAQNIPQYFSKYCRKYRVNINVLIQDKIAQKFYGLIQSNVLNTFDVNQKNQRKYLLSQICIFHYFLVQKTNYGQKLWSQRKVTFEQKQLDALIKYVITLGKNPFQLKTLISQIVIKLGYGAKLSDEEDRRKVQNHIKDLMKITALERNLFWQSLWADDKFPKSIQEYKQYVKLQLSSIYLFYQGYSQIKNTHSINLNFSDIFEINQGFQRQKQQQIFQIMKKMNKNVQFFLINQISLNIEYLSEVKKRISQALDILNSVRSQVNRFAAIFYTHTMKISLDSQDKRLEILINGEKIKYLEKYTAIKQNLQYYLQIQPIQYQDNRFFEQISQNKISKHWKTNSKLTIKSYLTDLVQNIRSLDRLTQKWQKQKFNQLKNTFNGKTQIVENSTLEKRPILYSLKSLSNVDSLFQFLRAKITDSIDSEEIFFLSRDIVEKVMSISQQKIQKVSSETNSSTNSLINRIYLLKDLEIKFLFNVQNFYIWNASFKYLKDPNQTTSLKTFFQLFSEKQNNQQSYVKNTQFVFTSIRAKKQNQLGQNIQNREKNSPSVKEKFLNYLLHEKKNPLKQKGFIKRTQSLVKLQPTYRYQFQSVILSKYPLHYAIDTLNYNFVQILVRSRCQNSTFQEFKLFSNELERKRVHLFVNK